jgi:hypothetical protein
MLLDASSAIIPNAASAAETPGYAGLVLCKRHSPEGGYAYTNPGAMARWIFSVAFAGIVICSIGIWLLIRASKEGKNSN